jgi:hypothetical protein
MDRSIAMTVIPQQRRADEPAIRGQFYLTEPLLPGVSELDPRWFQPYPSQD